MDPAPAGPADGVPRPMDPGLESSGGVGTISPEVTEVTDVSLPPDAHAVQAPQGALGDELKGREADLGVGGRPLTPSSTDGNGATASEIAEVGSALGLSHGHQDLADTQMLSPDDQKSLELEVIDITDELTAASVSQPSFRDDSNGIKGGDQVESDSPMETEASASIKHEKATPPANGGAGHVGDDGVREGPIPEDDGGPSDGEPPVKRQRTDEEGSDKKISMSIAEMNHLESIRKQRELTEFEGWAYKDLLARSGRGGKKEGSDLKPEIMKEEEQKQPSFKKAPQKPANKVSTVHSAKEFWAKFDEEEKAGGRKRKFNMGVTIAEMVENSNSMEARAARGDVQLAVVTEATNKRRDEAIKRMSAPGAKRGDAATLNFALQSFGKGNTEPDPVAFKWKVAGIAWSLYPHQVVGVGEGLRKEISQGGKKGGILGDEPGLGKTVQIAAICICNPPTKAEKARKRHTTLIVCPASSINQFMAELNSILPKQEEKASGFDTSSASDDERYEDENGVGRVMQYKYKTSKETGQIWKKADYLFASYNEVAAACISNAKIKEIKKSLDAVEEKKLMNKSRGELLKHTFYRVVLDEGHAIKNHESMTSRACCALKGKYKWILTGTPMHNRSEELFPYFEFLGIDPGVGKLPPPSKAIGKGKGDVQGNGKGKGAVQGKGGHSKNTRPPMDADEVEYYAAMNKALKGVMIRRHANDKFLGHDILQIPQNHPVEIVRVELSWEELIVYTQLELRYLELIKRQKALKGTGRAQLGPLILIAITRVRQAISHPYLLEGIIGTVFSSNDFESVIKKFAEAGDKIPANSQVRKLVEMMHKRMGGSNKDGMPSEMGSVGSPFAKDPLLKALQDGQDSEGILCSVCSQLPENPTTTECGHTFCRDCLAGQFETKGKICPDCAADLDDSDPSKEFQHQIDDAGTPTDSTRGTSSFGGSTGGTSTCGTLACGTQASDEKTPKGPRKKTRTKIHGDDELFFQPPASKALTMLEEYDKHYPECKIAEGAKLVAAMKHIQKWQADAPGDKIIVFTQFMDTGAILGRMLCEEDIHFVQFWGELSMRQKDKAIETFFQVPEVKVMIASLRCGGQALNLTCANRVLILEPWWNKAVEVQAFGRVARIGQTKETYLAKIVADKTIEAHMVSLQGVKIEDIGKIMKEKEGDGTDASLNLLGGLLELDLTTRKVAWGKKRK